MAVGVIIGGAFSKIVTSLVNDILMPVTGRPDRQAPASTRLNTCIQPCIQYKAGGEVVEASRHTVWQLPTECH
ncbi:MAG: MscL family protein [Enterocloster sp.]